MKRETTHAQPDTYLRALGLRERCLYLYSGRNPMPFVLAAEFGSRRVRVNTILPGGTDTPMSFTNAPDATPEVLAFVEGLHALKRIARPEEIAQSVLHLASDASSFVTGTAFLVDGGVSICRT